MQKTFAMLIALGGLLPAFVNAVLRSDRDRSAYPMAVANDDLHPALEVRPQLRELNGPNASNASGVPASALKVGLISTKAHNALLNASLFHEVPDATRRDSTPSLVANRMESARRHSMLRHVTMLLQKNKRFEIIDSSWIAMLMIVSVISLVAGYLTAVFGRIYLRGEASRASHVSNVSRSPVASDGVSESSDEDEDEEEYGANHEDICTSLPSQRVAYTGLLWKLERRFIEDLIVHNGQGFNQTDRFAVLENWDLRFFSLDLNERAVLLSYVSELTEFASRVIEIRSIESQIIKIPMDARAVRKANSYGTSRVISFYDRYLSEIRQMGYDIKERGTKEPKTLHVFIVSGVRHDESDHSRSVGRVRWRTSHDAENQNDEQEESKLSRMCLGSAHPKDSKRWHTEILSLLRRVQFKAAGERSNRAPEPSTKAVVEDRPATELARRLATARIRRSNGKATHTTINHASSFGHDALTVAEFGSASSGAENQKV